MSDLQAKYNALLKMQAGDTRDLPQQIMNDVMGDMESARRSKRQKDQELQDRFRSILNNHSPASWFTNWPPDQY